MRTPGRVIPTSLAGAYRVIYHLPSQPLVSILIPNRDSAQMLSRCVDSLGRGSYANWELLVVENGSTDPAMAGYYEQLKKQPHVRVLEWARPFNYAAVNNFAVTHARGDLVLFLNPDTIVTAAALDQLVAIIDSRPDVAIVGPRIVDGTGRAASGRPASSFPCLTASSHSQIQPPSYCRCRSP